jgi:exodeoxyribonuclease I
MQSIFWHDYETWGADPSVDRPCQFAGVRTDEALNLLGEPVRLYCQPAPDVLPNPEACLITGIAPQKAQQEGLTEAAFIAKIHQEFSQPGTCAAGYNSLRFDDEVTRFTLFRNFFDPYEREWKNGNSRWDIIDTVRLCYALRPDTLQWPTHEGRISFKLELLTQANGIEHGAAHDAYSDVAATLALARLIRARQPQLYQHVFELRQKNRVLAAIDWVQKKPLLHISSRFSIEQGCAALVMPICVHPTNKNAILCINLSDDPGILLDLDPEALAARLFTPRTDVNETRVGVKAIHVNKCPVVLTPKLLDEAAQTRLNIDKARCEKHWQQLLQQDITEKLQTAFSLSQFAPRTDPERQLYDGFISPADKSLAQTLRDARGADLAQPFLFSDARLQQMVLRYKARNFPEVLSAEERAQWFSFCQTRLSQGEDGILSVYQLRDKIREIDAAQELNKAQKIVLQQLFRYAEDLATEFQLKPKCCW